MRPQFQIAVALCLLVSQGAFAQTEIEVRPGDFLYGFGGGFSFTRMYAIEAENAKAGARPFIGLSASYAMSYHWRTNIGGFYAMRSTLFDENYRVEQNGVDLQFAQQYKLDDLYFNIGVLMQSTITERVVFRGNSNFEDQRRASLIYDVPNFQLLPMLGLEFKVMDNWRFFSNYAFGLNNQSSVLQFGLLYRINKRNPPPESERRRRRRLAERQINQLRDGALLVRLKTSKPAIRAMEARGYTQMAAETEKDQRVENLSLINAFRSAYNFSEVKFFYSEDSRKVLEGEFEGIFLNDSLEKDSAVVLQSKKNIFTCELTNIEEDTARYFSHYEFVQTDNFATVQVPRFYGGGENTFYALVIKDREFNQLSRPFPYYSRALFKALKEHPGHGIFFFPLKIFFSDTPQGSVEDLNDKLYRYWHRKKD